MCLSAFQLLFTAIIFVPSHCFHNVQVGVVEGRSLMSQIGEVEGRNLISQDLSKPWDSHLYVVGTNHKAGSQVLRNIMRLTFDTLGANYSCREPETGDSVITSIGSSHMMGTTEVINRCSQEPNCPIHWNNGIAKENLMADREQAGDAGMRAVHIIRDPLQMIASAYCYHHEGNEQGSLAAPPNIMELNAKEGVPLVAVTMLPIIMQMVGAYQASDSTDTFVARYENLTQSSEGFDSTVANMFDFLFEDLITSAERHQIEINARVEDLHRGENGYSAGTGHVSDDDCKTQATLALQLIPAVLYSQYVEYQVILEYL